MDKALREMAEYYKKSQSSLIEELLEEKLKEYKRKKEKKLLKEL